MKKLFFILILFTSSILSQWQTFNISTSSGFNDVCVVSENIIWAAGYSSAVFRTTDAGVSWQSVNNGLPVLGIYHISAADENRAWIITYSSGNRIFATTNGGNSWTEQFYTPASYINKIHFFNQNTGYLLCDPVDSIANFFVTRNGGVNWIKSVNSPVIRNMYIHDNDVNSIDSNFLWFVTSGSTNDYSRFYKLTGGLNGVWQNYMIGSSPQQCSFASFKNSNEGVLISNTQGILSTTNGGVNWILRNSSIITDVAADFINIPGTDWILHSGLSNLRLSKDMCFSWQYINEFIFSFKCDAKDTNSIWVAASNGRLLKYNINYIGIHQISSTIPEQFILHQNYPNPFNPATTIKFELPGSGLIKVKILDVTGKVIFSLSEYKAAGIYYFTFNSDNLSSGNYFYSAEFNGLRNVKKMILIK